MYSEINIEIHVWRKTTLHCITLASHCGDQFKIAYLRFELNLEKVSDIVISYKMTDI